MLERILEGIGNMFSPNPRAMSVQRGIKHPNFYCERSEIPDVIYDRFDGSFRLTGECRPGLEGDWVWSPLMKCPLKVSKASANSCDTPFVRWILEKTQ